jgi:hypothetical protein
MNLSAIRSRVTSLNIATTPPKSIWRRDLLDKPAAVLCGECQALLQQSQVVV